MSYTDLHTHTFFCDAKDSPEDMVLSAIEKGNDVLGILTHAFVEFDRPCSIDPEREDEFIETVAFLKKKYADKIKLLCGIELDYYTTSYKDKYDYKLGAVHYFKLGEEYYPIDQSADFFSELVNDKFGGDYYAAAEEYYRLMANVLEKTGADVIAHIDLITKFNENDRLFDTSHPRYKAAWKKAVDALLPYGKPFEINTGAISRGYRTTPYPAPEIIEYIKSQGGKLILSSDAHAATGIDFLFEKYEGLLT